METTRRGAEDDPAALWNGPGGRGWVLAQDLLDRVFRPFETLLAEGLAVGSRVLDVGCGTGATTVVLARKVGAAGKATGIDISAPMIAAARARAEREGAPADFVCADAQSHAFPPAGFDAIVSRFGVMFFADPVVAFANLRRAATDDGELRFVAWRSPEENPFMTAAERAAAPVLPTLPPRRSDGPGQFAFADAERVRAILEGGGWARVDVQPIDVACSLPEADLDHYLTRLGPVGRALEDADDGTRARVLEAVRPAFDPYVRGSQVHFTAACWRVSTRVAAKPSVAGES